MEKTKHEAGANDSGPVPPGGYLSLRSALMLSLAMGLCYGEPCLNPQSSRHFPLPATHEGCVCPRGTAPAMGMAG